VIAGEDALTYLLAGGVPSKLRERCSGSYLMFAASAGSFFTKSVSSRSWISRATGALVEACRRHWRFEVCASVVFCVRRRLKNEAVTSCRAMVVVEVFACGWTRLHLVASLGMRLPQLDFRGAGSAHPNRACRLLLPRPITASLSKWH
jgi:hypothetical protein